MPVITLPDGSTRDFDRPVTVAEIAAAVGPGLARAALAGRVGGRLVDACVPVAEDAEVAVITGDDPEGLEILRHSMAHLLGQAVKQLYPDAQMAIGPVVRDGFYYDIARGEPFAEADLRRLEERIRELVAQDYDVVREVVTGGRGERKKKRKKKRERGRER